MRASSCMRSSALLGAASAHSRPAPFRAAALGVRPAGRRSRRHSSIVAAGWWPSRQKDSSSGGGAGGAASGSGSGSAGGVGLFPAGKRQARVQLPALMLAVDAADVLDPKQQASALDDISAAVAGGATAVVLRQGGEGSGELYEAAVRLKELLRGRAALLVADRTDIVDVVGADGALLSPDGLPTVVAKRMLQGGLALVGRSVGSSEAAAEAAADGANFLILEPPSGGAAPSGAEAAAARQRQRSSASIPVIAVATAAATGSQIGELLAAGVDGLVMDLAELSSVALALTQQRPANAGEAAGALLQQLGAEPSAAPPAPAASSSSSGAAAAAEAPAAVQLSQLLSTSREELVDAERQLFTEVLSFLDSWCPSLEEAQLLRDAVKQLDELFLLVVLGEFNSGKSAVVNALLGQRYLAEGILPTTNEINVLKHLDPEHVEGSAQDGDGVFTRYLPAELLKEVNVVDTPGTNVILGRQQRLTEEYVPRADLVLFVLSADRPLTESEVRFLQYVRQWGKKVVFVVNKVDILSSATEVDILSSATEVEEVVAFVRSNAARVLGVDEPQVLPVSARAAMEAKLAILGDSSSGNGALSAAQAAQLASHPAWQRSGFESLERFIFQFLTGGAGAGSSSSSNGASEGGRAGVESVRLKLESPLFVADALLSAAETQLGQELAVARADAESVRLVRSQLAAFRRDMEKEGQLQRDELQKQVAATAKKASAVVDKMLQLSNVEVITAYLLGKQDSGKLLPVAKQFEEELAGDATAGLKSLVKEHSAWLSSNCQRQLDNYRAFAETRAAALGQTLDGVLSTELEGLDSDAEARRRWRQMRQLNTEAEAAAAAPGQTPDAEAALVAVSALDPKTTEVMLEEEVREAVISTAGTAAGAGAFGVLLTAVLPTTVEDLLAMCLAAMVGYVSILNLPMRRAEAKRKLEHTTSAFAQDIAGKMEAELQHGLTFVLHPLDIAGKMEAELQHGLAMCEAEVLAFIEPLEQLTVAEVRRLEAAEAARADLVGSLDRLKQRVANVE
ncbi:putative transmembrane GTPase FZO- chloroplastic isoform A [Chlorella sorokiniana]|uniref:Transmembrane GTPase FZO-chloroplastic isoform A n=1 Tax=Chlorella sorokiniana TaxID=3076 RepID=A0A2P6U0X0_CHLSO|nr:putative transmembrane GTPase FZO- chloroplastic isoform A [Chlorella sorokiniana]|eukprot:PRW59965.1 putative transmembrane GTPase FZO- chloroplastic isoform A [Chlorella sorokiniana]